MQLRNDDPTAREVRENPIFHTDLHHGQTLDAQLEQLRAEGGGRIYREEASRAQADRRELLKLLKRVAPGDVVTVTRIDRLGPLDLRPVCQRQAHRGRRRAVPLAGRAVGRHGH